MTKTKDQIKKEIIEIIGNNKDLALFALSEYIVGIDGQEALFLHPIKPTYNPNVMILCNTTHEFGEAFNELRSAEIIEMDPCDILTQMTDSSRIVKMKKATVYRVTKSKEECWMPVLIKQGINFKK